MGSTPDRDDGGFTLVELLVVVLLLAVIGATTTGIVMSTLRTEQFQQEMQATMDDGRISLQRIRREVRAARQVYETSCEPSTVDCAPSTRLHFWVDQDQDQIATDDEKICYLTEEITAGSDQYQLVRWTHADKDTCEAPVPAAAQVIARTLVPNHGGLAAPFFAFDPDPTADPSDPATRNVHVILRLQVQTGRDFDHLDVESIVRLRNVA